MDRASFFGEILPVVSRAVDDDDEDETMLEATPVGIEWYEDFAKKSSAGCLKCQTLLVTVGRLPTAFADLYLLGADRVTTAARIFPDNTERRQSQVLYCLKSKPDVYILTCETEPDQAQTGSWTEKVFTSIDLSTAQVVLLCSGFASRYSCDVHPNQDSFMRSLTTSCFKGRPVFPYVEQPNVISGLPAQILTFLEVNKLSGVLYNCYSDTSSVDLGGIEPLQPLLKTKPFVDCVVGEEELGRRLKGYDAAPANTMYI